LRNRTSKINNPLNYCQRLIKIFSNNFNFFINLLDVINKYFIYYLILYLIIILLYKKRVFLFLRLVTYQYNYCSIIHSVNENYLKVGGTAIYL